MSQQESPRYSSIITVRLQPEEKYMTLPRAKAKTAARLLELLGLKPQTALVARDGVLLTPDVHIYPGQTILVRQVMSRG